MEASEIQKTPRGPLGEELIIPQPYKWVYLDLKGNWLGLRVEPEDKARSEAFKDAVPKEERWYNRQDRKWMFRAQHGALLFALLQSMCPAHLLIFERESADVIKSLLMGPGRATGQEIVIPGLPTGRIEGNIEALRADGR
jgi:hypothetical protein